MRRRSTITAYALGTACLPSMMAPASSFLIAPPAMPTVARPRGASMSLRSRNLSSPASRRAIARAGNRCDVGGRSMLSDALRPRSRRRSHVTRTSMVFSGAGGGGGPRGFDFGTVATIVFGLLVLFAPGVIFGAFNTLFLVSPTLVRVVQVGLTRIHIPAF